MSLRTFIDSFSKVLKDNQLKGYLDSLSTIYYVAPVTTGNSDMGVLFSNAGNVLSFNSLLQNTGNRILVIDFWATWCGPCRYQMPFMHAIQRKYKGKPVKFITISIDTDDKVDEWHAASKAENLEPENNYRLKRGNFNKLLQYYGIRSVPRYMLFDQNGSLITDNFPEPTSRQFEKELDRHLEQNRKS